MTNDASPFSASLPYPSRRSPVFAQSAVATSQPLAAQAGLKMLQQGGNAVDAALATAMALTVVEPTSNGLGSDAFAFIWDGAELHGLNASGRSPKALTRSHVAGLKEMPNHGWLPVTVPGAVSAWSELSRRFGTLPLETVAEPAVRYAREGFLVGPMTSGAWERSLRLKDQPGFAEAFLPEGRAPKMGELFTCEAQARTLERVAATGGKAFYTGDLADNMLSFSKQTGGLFRESDLAEHRAEWVDSLSQSVFGAEVHELPPNGQGVAALMALGMLEHTELADLQPGSADALHLQLEAMKLAFADLYAYVADPRHMPFSPEVLLDEAYLQARAATIDTRKAGRPAAGVPRQSDTVYLCTADSGGMMVSFIQSNYMGFGSGVVVPGTGISLQNRGAGFSLEKGHPNEIAGGKKPFHTIIPGFITQGGRALSAFGVMGGAVQAQGHVQVTLRTLLHNENPQAALDAPRWQVLADGRVAIESGYAEQVLAELRGRGHDVVVSPFVEDTTHFFGGGQMIWRLQDGYVAASDPRREGQAVGW